MDYIQVHTISFLSRGGVPLIVVVTHAIPSLVGRSYDSGKASIERILVHHDVARDLVGQVHSNGATENPCAAGWSQRLYGSLPGMGSLAIY